MSPERKLLLLPLLLIFFITLQCAKISAPPGGPVDKTPPNIISTYPPADSIGVGKDNKISITFSEDVNKTTIDGAIFISPRFEGDIKYKWKGKTLNINLPDSFADSTTYIVNVGATVADLRSNKMDNSYILAFSTGDKIDQGYLSGTVYQDDKPYPDASIGLFKLSPTDSLNQFDSTYPPYLTQSGKSGEYTFEYIPDGEFFILAFNDKNKGQLFSYPIEYYGLPDRPANITSNREGPGIDFYMQKDDTAAIEILSTTITPDGLLKVRFSTEVPSDSLRENHNRISLVPVTPDSSLHPVTIKQRPHTLSSTYLFYFDNIPDGIYRFVVETDLFGHRNDSIETIQSEEFSITALTDDTPPTIDSVSFKDITIFPTDNVLELYFSEPIRKQLSEDAFIIMDNDSNLYNINFRWPDRFGLYIYIEELKWNAQYTMTISESRIFDLAGNALGDSVLTYSFSTYDQDSLGSVSGTITLKPSVDTTAFPFIKFTSIDRKFIYEERVLTGQYNFALPPGKYLLSGFLDQNNNGFHDIGNLFPFRYAETATFYPDTIRVRSRFETAGIELIFD